MENRLLEFESEPHKHEFVHKFILKNVSPPMGWKAVYAEHDMDKGGAYLMTIDLDLLGVANVVTREYCGIDLVDKFSESQVVGIHMMDGVQEIANEKENFAGLMPPGGDMDECTTALANEYYVKLPQSIRNRNPRSE